MDRPDKHSKKSPDESRYPAIPPQSAERRAQVDLLLLFAMRPESASFRQSTTTSGYNTRMPSRALLRFLSIPLSGNMYTPPAVLSFAD